MNKISIIKKIQLGQKTFPIENLLSELHFNFYCGKGGIKHQVILSTETSSLLNLLIDSGQIDNTLLAKNEVDKLPNLENKQRIFPYRYQILNSEECNNTYLIVFDIYEYREYYSCTVYGVLQIE
ncbi:hypothetical protein [Flavobacterium collinsii]|uniref:Uncharacterized protein n=1 Tax=Flavobacterium collinsii TaxID=1114861 RepID=A0A9W4TI13_9FLAO|nr:hypothetical protein [Flavobacterium collinsii]CAA9203455.1 hypothetical protein FLACOL7796_04747 [Flavobacterium collinsii]CAI2767606.1 conserved protein of unknown function [Flavobacterium collinsii]